MKAIKFLQKNSVSGEPIKIVAEMVIDAEKALTSESTNSIYVRIGFLNGTPFLSQKGNGNGGSGDITTLTGEVTEMELQFNLFERVKIWAEKNNLIVNINNK